MMPTIAASVLRTRAPGRYTLGAHPDFRAAAGDWARLCRPYTICARKNLNAGGDWDGSHAHFGVAEPSRGSGLMPAGPAGHRPFYKTGKTLPKKILRMRPRAVRAPQRLEDLIPLPPPHEHSRVRDRTLACATSRTASQTGDTPRSLSDMSPGGFGAFGGFILVSFPELSVTRFCQILTNTKN